MIYKELCSNDSHIAKINGVQFCLMSPEEIVARSAAEITKNETYNSNEPVPNGLFDARMGVVDHNHICKTCEQRNIFCPGHFGHMVLAKPVFYVHFMDIVRKLLRCVCHRCSCILVNPESPEVQAIQAKRVSRQKRWELMLKLCLKVKRCGQDNPAGCGAKTPDKISKTDHLRIQMEWKESSSSSVVSGGGDSQASSMMLNAEDVLRIFKRITDSDAQLLGFGPKYNRPEWMICTVLPIAPPAVRPTVRTETGQRLEDDLTYKFSDIVKCNNHMKARLEKGASQEQIEYSITTMQYHVATLIDNGISYMYKSTHRDGRAFKSLTDRLKGKEGRIRGNLMGKRVDFSARTVITPDPNISIDEIGVPVKIAMNLTFPEIVNEYNVERLTTLVNNGPDTYPGAKHVRKTAENNRTVRLKGSSVKVTLEYGDVVERHLQNGDYVLFNRQPSLHKMSMMAHRVRVMEYNTFRLNVCVCANYNADFDGDEMNVHVPQSLQTHQELLALAAVPLHIISPRFSKPLVTPVQDVAVGAFRITQPHVRITDKQMCNLMAINPNFQGLLPEPGVVLTDKTRYWTGRQALSMIIPDIINLSMNSDVEGDPDTSRVIIKNGVVESGILGVKAYKLQSRGLVHTIYNELGAEALVLFLNNTQKLICDWLVLSGFSVGVSDLLIPDAITVQKNQLILDMKRKVQDIVNDVHANKFENMSTRNNYDFFDEKVDNIMKACNCEITKKITSSFDIYNNRMLNMILSGSKGNSINFMQMVGCLGQQFVEGKRIQDGFEYRTLPHFSKFDDGPESRGFVENSFIAGLKPHEFFFHSMGGRIGLIDTAVRTSETGYIQRKLVKAMEDSKINFDLTVRNASGHIIQFMYGEDGMDAVKLEYVFVPYIDMDIAAVRETYGFFDAGLDELKHVVRDDVLASVDRAAFDAAMRRHFEQLMDDRREIVMNVHHGELTRAPMLHPINYLRTIEAAASAQAAAGIPGVLLDTDPLWALERIERLAAALATIPVNAMLVRCFLSPKVLVCKHRLCRQSIERLCEQINDRFCQSFAHPGEMVGIVAAQSIGEPTTQMTLNTFHLSGVSHGSVTQGVPRLRELISVTKNIKTPAMKICMRPPFNTDIDRCGQVMSTLQTTHFRDIVKHTKIYFDPPGQETVISEDKELIDFYHDFTEQVYGDQTHASPWVLRFEFDRMKLLDLQICMMELQHVLEDFYGSQIQCIFSDDNAEQLLCRIRLNMNDTSDVNDILTELKALEQNILENDSVVIKGVAGIHKAEIIPPKADLPKFDPMADVFVPNAEIIIKTIGSNLMEVMCHDMVDYTRTISNDTYEVFQTLGIEAARRVLLEELQAVMWKDDQENVNYRHMSLLIDTMTNRGHLVSIDRHGINRGESGPLAKCSFEETTLTLVKAGIFAEADRINGVSANIMLGQVPPCGTGDCEVYIDNAALDALVPPAVPSRPEASDFAASSSEESQASAGPIRFRVPEASKTKVAMDDDDDDDMVVIISDGAKN